MIAIVIAIVACFMPSSAGPAAGASGSRFPNGVSANATSPVAGELRGTTLTLDGAGSTAGLLTMNGGALFSNTLSTSTGSATMNVSYLSGYDTVIVDATGANSAKTLTFFASSTASSWLPTAGDTQRTCFVNATSGPSLIFAAGTGIDLEVATSTGGAGGAMDLTIAPNGMGCFTFVRGVVTATAFDIHAGLIEYSDGD